jgi:DNA-binding transcriptional MerR regulator
MSVSALSERVGVRPDTVRYYEPIGLLPPPARTRAEHRRYDETAVDRLQFVQGAQRLDNNSSGGIKAPADKGGGLPTTGQGAVDLVAVL